jgi:hypothetical protein
MRAWDIKIQEQQSDELLQKSSFLSLLQNTLKIEYATTLFQFKLHWFIKIMIILK